MAEAITAQYVQGETEWTVTVFGRGKKLTGRAVGIIAARDRAEQMAEQIAPFEDDRTVVHLLHGSALEFSTAYMSARLSLPGGPQHSANGRSAENSVTG